jgi:hypothetical protein
MRDVVERKFGLQPSQATTGRRSSYSIGEAISRKVESTRQRVGKLGSSTGRK